MKYEFSVKPLCLYIGAVRKKDKTTFKVGQFFYDFKHNQWEMAWDSKEFEYKRDCILSLLPNEQGIPLITTSAGFRRLMEKHNIADFIDIELATNPS